MNFNENLAVYDGRKAYKFYKFNLAAGYPISVL